MGGCPLMPEIVLCNSESREVAHNKELLFYERQKEIIQTIDKLDLE